MIKQYAATMLMIAVFSISPAGAAECQRQEPAARPSIVELVRYRLKSDISDQTHRDAAGALMEFLCKQPGFVRRVLSKSGDGLWVDYIEWENATLAGEAAIRAQSDPVAAPFLQSIKAESIEFGYFDINLRID